MVTQDCIEAAYCFFHQKYRVYQYSSDIRQKEDIEYAVESYVNTMSPDLYLIISKGDSQFLRDYTMFQRDMESALAILERLL